MGGCCGKGATPKDPDKTPYSPSKKTENLESEKQKLALKPEEISTDPAAKEKASPKQSKEEKRLDGDADSFVIIELDKESKPQVVEPATAAKAENAEKPSPTTQATPSVVDAEPSKPVEKSTKETTTPVKVAPIAVPKEATPKESVFSPRPVEGKTELPNLVVTPTNEEEHKKPVAAPQKAGTPGKTGDASPKTAGLTRQQAISIGQDDSSTSSFDDSVVATPDVVLRIDEPGRDVPAPGGEKSPPASPQKKTFTASGTARPSSLDTPKSSKLGEDSPDPKTIIENVRNKAKKGNYGLESSFTSIKETSTVSSSGVVSTVTKVVTTVEEGLDSNQNKDDPAAVLNALKPSETKKEVTTKTEITVVEKREAPVRVSKLPSPTGAPTPPKKYGSPEPASPKHDSAASGLKMPSVVVKMGTRTSPQQGPKSPANSVEKVTITPTEAKPEARPTVEEKSDARPVSHKTEVDTSVTGKGEMEAPPINKTDKESHEAVKNDVGTPRKTESNSAASSTPSSFYSSKSTSPSKSTDSSYDNLKVNGMRTTSKRSEKHLQILPDFSQSNAAVAKRHRYCANTRMQALVSIDKWMKDSSAEKSRVMLVKGQPGMGKTTLLAEICSRHEQNVAAYHYFNYNSYDLNHNDLKYALLWLVKSFTTTIETFVNGLPKAADIEELVNFGSIDDVIQGLIVKGFRYEEFQHDTNHKMIIVIDALDECHIADREKLFEFVDNFTNITPSWLHLCVSFRTDNQLENFLTTADVIELKNNNDNMADIKRMMKESLGHFMDRISLDGGLTQLAKKTHGSPLCAALYNRILDSLDKRDKIALREIDIKFATDLDGVLSNVLSSFKKSINSDKGSEQKYSNLIGMLALARQPVNQIVVSNAGFKDIDHTLEQLKAVVDVADNDIVIVHKVVAEWLLDPHKGGDLGVEVNTAKATMAANCTTWLEPLIGESNQAVPPPLTEYAVKHAVSHLTDKPKEQENVARTLCSLRVLHQKLELGGIDSAMRDYRHEHEQVDHSHKRVSLHDYMKKVPKLEEQVKLYKSFLKDNYIHLKYAPSSLFQLAANNTKAQRIQQNARIELTSLPWLEDLTAVAETHSTSKSFIGTIVCADLSPDGKTIAFTTKDNDNSLHLHQYHTQTLEPKISFLDITTLSGRLHAKDCCKYLPDGLHIFVGSLETFINNKGKSVPSGYDVASTQLKEKAAVETCSVSSKYLAASLTTFPFNGRSVHLSLFGVKEKKALKTIEVLKFRFGGNAQFGIKGCAISPDEKSLAACIKQNNKHEIKINIWAIGKWNITHTLDLACEQIKQCEFGEMSTLLLNMGDSTSDKCLAWKTTSGNEPAVISDDDTTCCFAVSKTHITVCAMNSNTGNATVKKWKKAQPIQQDPSNTYLINGLGVVKNLLLMHSNFVVCEEQTIKVFDPSDLDDIGPESAGNLQICDMNTESVAFMPRSDTLIAATRKRETASVYTCENFGEDLHVIDTPLTGNVTSDVNQSSKVFRGKALSSQRCFVSNDGSCYILNLGKQILLWSTSNDQVEPLPLPSSVGPEAEATLCLPSPKDSIVAVVYSQSPHVVHLHDLKAKHVQRQVELGNMQVCDLFFMPSNGYLVTYHGGAERKLAIWNQRTAKSVSVEPMDVSFVKVSQSSDRLILSKLDGNNVGQLLLRSSDLKVSVVLNTDQSWSSGSDTCDAEFSPDGTVLIGVDNNNDLCRIWNAGNGDFLKDMKLSYRQCPFIVGMPTNTHVALCDSRITILDIASGETLCVAPITCAYKRSHCQLSVSPRGNVIAGTSLNGRALVYRLHNFSAIKMKTTLQRMKSFSS